jgi:hypothetical protein
MLILEAIATSSNLVFKHFESYITVSMRMLGYSTQVAMKSNILLNYNASS